jgi:hypothetical protein
VLRAVVAAVWMLPLVRVILQTLSDIDCGLAATPVDCDRDSN